MTSSDAAKARLASSRSLVALHLAKPLDEKTDMAKT
jgi:hypothetical protein